MDRFCPAGMMVPLHGLNSVRNGHEDRQGDDFPLAWDSTSGGSRGPGGRKKLNCNGSSRWRSPRIVWGTYFGSRRASSSQNRAHVGKACGNVSETEPCAPWGRAAGPTALGCQSAGCHATGLRSA